VLSPFSHREKAGMRESYKFMVLTIQTPSPQPSPRWERGLLQHPPQGEGGGEGRGLRPNAAYPLSPRERAGVRGEASDPTPHTPLSLRERAGVRGTSTPRPKH